MRKVVAISMPQHMHDELLKRLAKTNYATVSEYIRDLIRKDAWAEELYPGDAGERKQIEGIPATKW